MLISEGETEMMKCRNIAPFQAEGHLPNQKFAIKKEEKDDERQKEKKREDEKKE